MPTSRLLLLKRTLDSGMRSSSEQLSRSRRRSRRWVEELRGTGRGFVFSSPLPAFQPSRVRRLTFLFGLSFSLQTQYAEAPHSPSGRGHRPLRDSESPFSGSEDSENSDSDSASEGPLSPESKQLSQGVKRTRQKKVAPQEQRRLGPEPTTSDPKAVLRAMAAIGEKIEIASALSPLLHEATSRQVHPDRRRALFDQAVTIFVPAMHLFSFPTDAFVPHYPSVVRYITSMPYLSPGQVAPPPIQQQRPLQPLPPRAAASGPSSHQGSPGPSSGPPRSENGVAGPSNGGVIPSVFQVPVSRTSFRCVVDLSSNEN